MMLRPDSYPPLVSPSTLSLFASVLVLASASACVPEFYDETAPPDDLLVGTEPDAEPAERTKLQNCEPQVQWVTERPTAWGMGVPFLDVTPNDGLVLRSDPLYSGETLVMRTSDGETLAEGYDSPFITADTDFGRKVAVSWDRIEVKDMITSEVLSERLAAESHGFEAAALDATGQKLTMLSCHLGGQTLITVDAMSGALLHDVELSTGSENEWCNGMWQPMDHVLFVPGQNKVIVALGETGELVLVDLDNDSVVRQVAHDPDNRVTDRTWMLPAALIDVAVHPSGDRVASTGADGALRVFDLPGLTARPTTGEIGFVPVNLNAYATPRWSSDVAYSRDGALLITVGTDNLPRLRDAESLAVLADLDAGVDVEATLEDPTQAHALPTGFAFSRQDEMLVVEYGNAFAGFACAPWKPEADQAEAPMNVTLDVPASATAGETIVLTATHTGSPKVHSHTFLIDGERIGGGGLARTATFYAPLAGVHEVQVRVSDGIHSGTATRTLTVD